MTEYGNRRFWYLRELSRLRVAASDTTKERREVQRKLAALRKSNLQREYV